MLSEKHKKAGSIKLLIIHKIINNGWETFTIIALPILLGCKILSVKMETEL